MLPRVCGFGSALHPSAMRAGQGMHNMMEVTSHTNNTSPPKRGKKDSELQISSNVPFSTHACSQAFHGYSGLKGRGNH